MALSADRTYALELPSTSLVALEMAGKLRRQLRSCLEAAGISDLKQLQGRSRFEVRLIPGVSTKFLATIDTMMREAGLGSLHEDKPRGRGRHGGAPKDRGSFAD
jgi:hypothetical protein